MWHSTSIHTLKSRTILSIFSHGNIRMKLKFFIQVNGLYTKQDIGNITVSEYLKRKKRANIQNAIKVKYKFEKGKLQTKLLYIKLIKSSSTIDKKLTELTNQLQSLFNCELISLTNNINNVEYVLNYKKINDEKNIINLDDSFLNDTAPTGILKINNIYQFNYHKLPHFLICGNTGSGKSYLSYYLLWQMLKEAGQDEVYVCDAKFDEMKRLARGLGITHIADGTSSNTAYGQIKMLVREFDNLVGIRYRIDDPRKFENKPMFLIIDEYAALIENLSKTDSLKLASEIKDIVLRSRAVNMHLLIILQRAEGKTLDLAIRDNMSVRIGMGNLSKQNYEMLFGTLPDENLIKRNCGQGRLLIDGKSVVSFDAPHLKINKSWFY